MAHRVEVVLLDDTDPEGNTLADETVSFSLDGIIYEIDLSKANAATLRDALGRYVAASRRVEPNGGRSSNPGRRTEHVAADNRTIRAWAQSNGHPVSDRGRIPSNIVDAFKAAER